MKAYNILVVDDDRNIANLLNESLSENGWHISIAREGIEALQMVNDNPPDLIVLDLMLPKIDGFEVCRQVYQSSQIPIIILSARCEMEDKVTCLNLGADDYITKPFGIDELIARINAVIRRNKITERINIMSPFVCDDIIIDTNRQKVLA